MSAMYAYVQPGLIGSSPRTIIEELEESAHALGGSIWGRVYAQEPSPVGELWALVTAFDHAHGGTIAADLERFASESGTDLHTLLTAPPPTSALWALLDALTHPDAGYLLMPSPEHLDGLGVPKTLIQRLISRLAPHVHVVHLDTRPAGGRGVIVAVDVPAAALAQDIVSLRVRQRLQRAGLADITPMVDALLTEMVAEAMYASARTPGNPDQLHIAVLCPPENTTVVIDVVETRDHSQAPIGDGLQRICIQTGATPQRWRSDTGGTLTRCLLALPDTLQPTMVQPTQPRR
ncbi:hypothetical protein [Nocardia brevicatena]|uniref:hypothetical protein n=1 Tax=Nocardia brevicatena TaxID=37327 RepID=UPI000316EC0E|nr:hypothetical protein [Nocardia brevicatena]